MYRDRRENDEVRIAYLEERLREQTAENEALRCELARRNLQGVNATRTRVDGRERSWRFTAITATAFAAASVTVAIAVVVGTLPEQEPERLTEFQELPILVEVGKAAVGESVPARTRYLGWSRTSSGDRRFDAAAQKRALYAKMMAKTAGTDELRMLKAICMADGDRACRNAATAELNRQAEW